MTAPVCPDCRGEGEIRTAIPGGAWEPHAGTWIPDERIEHCGTCHGWGLLEEEGKEDE